MNQILFLIGDWPVRINDALIAFGVLTLALLLIIAIVIARSGRRGAEFAMAQAAHATELEQRLSEMLRVQNEATGRADARAQELAGRQAEIARTVNDRLELRDPSGRPIDGTDHAQHHGQFARAA